MQIQFRVGADHRERGIVRVDTSRLVFLAFARRRSLYGLLEHRHELL
jgi:hypothetical protein